MPKHSDRFHLNSPLGTSLFSFLNQPSTKFRPEGEYFVVLSIGAKEAKPLIDKIDHTLEEFKQEANISPKLQLQGQPYAALLDDQDQDTGFYKFKFVRRGRVSKEDGSVELVPPALFNAKGEPIRVSVGNGSKLIVNYNLNPWISPLGYGVSLRLNAVQVIDLVSGFAQGDPLDAASWGFGIHAEGFEANTSQRDASQGTLPQEDSDEIPF